MKSVREKLEAAWEEAKQICSQTPTSGEEMCQLLQKLDRLYIGDLLRRYKTEECPHPIEKRRIESSVYTGAEVVCTQCWARRHVDPLNMQGWVKKLEEVSPFRKPTS